jgi:GTP-binding protein LepA
MCVYLTVITGADKVMMMANGIRVQPVEIGIFSPACYRLTSLKQATLATLPLLEDCFGMPVGDTITNALQPAASPVPGYRKAKPMVYAGVYPTEGKITPTSRKTGKMQLNDASLVYEPETSEALNFGFRCGFLGLFHMEIIQERLEREYNLDVVFTAPSVEYEVQLVTGKTIIVDSPADLPDEGLITEIREPWMELNVFSPTEYYGVVMDLVRRKRGVYVSEEYLRATASN